MAGCGVGSLPSRTTRTRGFGGETRCGCSPGLRLVWSETKVGVVTSGIAADRNMEPCLVRGAALDSNCASPEEASPVWRPSYLGAEVSVPTFGYRREDLANEGMIRRVG